MVDGAWWEPPIAASEVEHLLGALDRQRATFRWKVDGLDTEALHSTFESSALTLAGLLSHLAFVEDFTSATKLAGASPGDLWAELDWDGPDDPSFGVAGSAQDLYALYDDAVARARSRYAAALADGGLDQLAAVSDDAGARASLRRLLFDLLEEYARHTGHADLLREAVDGRVGEDPPAGWTPSPHR